MIDLDAGGKSRGRDYRLTRVLSHSYDYCVILFVVGPGLYNSGVLDAHIWAGMQLLCSGPS